MCRDARATVLAALREIHDGYLSRNIGADGGRTFDWRGRIVVVGAVTTAWDRAHDVTAAMGDRFVLVRMDSANKANPGKERATAPRSTPAPKSSCGRSWLRRPAGSSTVCGR
jgi:hypothetical protein